MAPTPSPRSDATITLVPWHGTPEADVAVGAQVLVGKRYTTPGGNSNVRCAVSIDSGSHAGHWIFTEVCAARDHGHEQLLSGVREIRGAAMDRVELDEASHCVKPLAALPALHVPLPKRLAAQLKGEA